MNARTGLTAAVLAAVLGLGAASAWADTNPANDFGVFTVRIQPNVDLGVTVDTTGSAWEGSADLDITMDLGGQKRLDTGVKLTVAGNFSKQELQLTGAALNTWTLNAAETDVQDKIQLHALIGADQAAAPAYNLFDGVGNLVTTTPARAGQPQANEAGDTNHTYEFATGQAPEYSDVDDMAVGQMRRLWLRSIAPTTTTVDTQQAFTVTVTALTGTAQ